MQVTSIAESLFFTTIRIDTVTTDGNHGSGTGFLFALKMPDGSYMPFVVTNKHVVIGMKSGSLTFHQRKDEKPNLGSGFRLELVNWSDFWFGHPNPDIDIAVTPFAPLESYVKKNNGIDLFYRFITSDLLPTAEQIDGFDAIESITFIGYPNGIWDTKNLLPVARRGTTASPMSVSFENTPRFLIDASVFGGSSGSPVFILNQGMITDKHGNTTLGSRIVFVGVVAAVFFRTQLNQIIAVPIPTQTQPMAQQQEMIDLGIVFRSETVVQAIQAFVGEKGVA